jgi:putative membrane protein
MAKINQATNYKPIIWSLAITINGLVAVAFFLPELQLLKKYDFSLLPSLNAILNSLTFVSLLIALIHIRNKNINLHRSFIFTALFFTSLFLLSYLLYHYSTPSTHFGGTGIVKNLYYFILITHIILAVLVVPLALFSIGRGLNMEVGSHRKIARWTMPIWLYVSLTGVVVYFMISPYYS